MTDAADEDPLGGARMSDILLISENRLSVRNPHNEIVHKMDPKMGEQQNAQD